MNTRPRFFCTKYQRYNKNSKLFIRYFSMYSLAVHLEKEKEEEEEEKGSITERERENRYVERQRG